MSPICLYVGRLDREKSVGRVIDAFGAIATAVSGSRLLLVGQGTHEASLRRASRPRARRPRESTSAGA